jgi:cobalt-zinc-cadmium efflux system protein
MTAHLVMPNGHPGDDAVFQVATDLRTNFDIEHVTLQIEIGNSTCPLAPDYVV